jgi:hypothetical protein
MNAVLLTGAGFTKTFGGYLASEMWATILNQPEVQNSPELLKGMRDLENLDYEKFYEDIQASGTEQQRKDLNAAIRSAFKEMDDNIRTGQAQLTRTLLLQSNLSNCSRSNSKFHLYSQPGYVFRALPQS